MSEELYIDSIGDVVVTGMVIRFDLMALDPSQRDDKNNIQPTVRQRVVMPIDGFVTAVQKLGGTLSKLEKMGVIKKTRKPGSVAQADPAEVTRKILDSALKTGFNSDGKLADPK